MNSIQGKVMYGSLLKVSLFGKNQDQVNAYSYSGNIPYMGGLDARTKSGHVDKSKVLVRPMPTLPELDNTDIAESNNNYNNVNGFQTASFATNLATEIAMNIGSMFAVPYGIQPPMTNHNYWDPYNTHDTTTYFNTQNNSTTSQLAPPIVSSHFSEKDPFKEPVVHKNSTSKNNAEDKNRRETSPAHYNDSRVSSPLHKKNTERSNGRHSSREKRRSFSPRGTRYVSNNSRDLRNKLGTLRFSPSTTDSFKKSRDRKRAEDLKRARVDYPTRERSSTFGGYRKKYNEFKAVRESITSLGRTKIRKIEKVNNPSEPSPIAPNTDPVDPERNISNYVPELPKVNVDNFTPRSTDRTKRQEIDVEEIVTNEDQNSSNEEDNEIDIGNTSIDTEESLARKLDTHMNNSEEDAHNSFELDEQEE